MTTLTDPGYGRQFADFYDRIFPGGEAAEPVAARLAELHTGRGRPALELGVGTGRIARPLAARIGQVVGVDSSAEMLAQLEAALADDPQPVTPVLGDMRSYADGREYGLVYCVLGTLSIVLDEQEQAAVLAVCARAAAPGAPVVIETHNPAFVQATHGGRPHETMFVPYPGRDTGLLSHSTLDREQRLWRLSHVFFEEGSARHATETSRLTSPEEIDAYAEAAGLRPEARHADWSGTSARGDEPMVICTYRR
jgi:SAM-dependent methyltransferase